MSESRAKYEAALDLGPIRDNVTNDYDTYTRDTALADIRDLINEVERLRAMLKTVVAQLPNEDERRLLEAERIMQSPFLYINLKKL